MAEKLTETTWTAFAKKQKLSLDDKALVKALAAFDKVKESDHEPRLKAVEEVVKQIPEHIKALTKQKKEIGDKLFGEVKDKLYGLLEVAEVLQKEVEKAVDAASKSAGSSDDDEESPALLTTKMIPLLREVRKGDVVLQSLIAVAGKETVVLLSRKSISPARGKLLKEQMTNPGGLKLIRGECLFEANAVTFVVQAAAAGLAKKVKAALLAQTDMRLKVRVRGEDGAAEEDGDEEGGGERAGDQTAGAQATAQAAPAAAGAAAAGGQGQAAEPGPAGVDAGVAFKARLAALLPGLKTAQTANHPSSQDARLKVSEAGVFANKRDFERAHALLDEAEQLLQSAPQRQAQQPPTADFTARLKVFLQQLPAALSAAPAVANDAKLKASEAGVLARKGDLAGAAALLDQAEALLRGVAAPRAATAKPLSVWIDAKELVGTQISQLQAGLRQTQHPLFREIADKGLNAITDRLQVGLQVALMEFNNASTPEARDKAKAAVLTQLAGFRSYVQGNAALQLIDENPLNVKVGIRSALNGAFDTIEQALAG